MRFTDYLPMVGIILGAIIGVAGGVMSCDTTAVAEETQCPVDTTVCPACPDAGVETPDNVDDSSYLLGRMDGYEDGFADGDKAGFNRGYTTGLPRCGAAAYEACMAQGGP